MTKNPALETLDAYGNRLAVLGVTQNARLANLYCYNNLLTSLDVSQNTKLLELKCQRNQYRITVDESRTFDLGSLAGFDTAKASGWNGGTVSGSTLTVAEGAEEVTYTYDLGNGFSETFTLLVEEAPVEPTEPTDPAETTEPTEPTEPAKPADPTETTEPAEPSKPTEPNKPAEPSKPVDPSKPDTGDSSHVTLWTVLIAAACVGILLILIRPWHKGKYQ